MAIMDAQVWQSMTDKAKKKLRGKATATVQAQILRVLNDAVKVSPQWSGDFAFNWQISTNAYGAGYLEYFKVDPWKNLQWWDVGAESTPKDKKEFAANNYDNKPMAKYAGSPKILALALSRNAEMVSNVKWNTKVKLVNLSPSADIVNDPNTHIRRVNQVVPGNVGVLAYLKAKYKYLS